MVLRRAQQALFLALMAVLMGCATVPVTGRRQLAFIPASELQALGSEQYREILKEAKLSSDRVQAERVRTIGRRLARVCEEYLREQGRAAEANGFAWEFNLIQDDKTVNAFCLPGGKVAVYTGILPLTRDDAGLATVIAHEIGHALAQHGSERLSQMLLAQFGSVLLEQALAKSSQKTRELLTLAYGVGTNVGVVLPYSRLQEKEADYIGLILMARAGYEPEAAVEFWQRMAKSGGSRAPEFLSTHPAPETRIQALREHLPAARAEFRPQS